MTKKKKFSELLLKDNFLFGAIMMDEEICREFLEIVLSIRISHVTVSKEYSIVYHPEYKGVRLDAYACDDENTRYNIEMQVVSEKDLRKRSRYYHSQIDMDLLLSGQPYEKLPKCFVIFLGDFDPFGKGLYRYSFQNQCQEEQNLFLEDGSISVFLNTHGKNKDAIHPTLFSLLEFVKADLVKSEAKTEDEFVKKLQATIRRIKASREMERRFMTFEELLKDERAEGKAEGKAEGLQKSIIKFLQNQGSVSEELKAKILAETDLDRLDYWLEAVIHAGSVEEFAAEIGE